MGGMRGSRIAGLAGGAALGLLLLGCPDTALIETPLGQLQLEFEVNPPATDRFEIATVTITAMRFVPADDKTAQAAANQDLGFVERPVVVDLNTAGTVTVAAVPITVGSYKFTEFALLEFHLEDEAPPTSSTECLDLLRALSDRFSEKEFPNAVKQALTSSPVIPIESGVVSVTQDGLTTIRVTINGQAFVDVVERHFIGCRTTGSCFNFARRSAPCVELFFPNRDGNDLAVMVQEMLTEVFSITPAP